jgi:hypothetical protein
MAALVTLSPTLEANSFILLESLNIIISLSDIEDIFSYIPTTTE